MGKNIRGRLDQTYRRVGMLKQLFRTIELNVQWLVTSGRLYG